MILSKHAKFHKVNNDKFVVFNNILFEPIEITSEEKEYLKNKDFSRFKQEEIEELKDKGIIINYKTQDLEAEKIIKEYFNQESVISLMYLIPTNYCNLKCKYCL